MRRSLAMPSASSVSAANRMVSQSDWLPMMMATGAVIQTGSFHKSRSIRRIIGLAAAWQGRRNGLWFMVNTVTHEEETQTRCSEGCQARYRQREDGDQTRSGCTRQAR